MKKISLPEYPWDMMIPYIDIANNFSGGKIDLSLGTPIDSTPVVAQKALSGASDSPGYPFTIGSLALRESIVTWFSRVRGVDSLDVDQVFPTIGSKEFIASLPLFLGISSGDVVVFPEVAYPTYDIGVRFVDGCGISADVLSEDILAKKPMLVWINSPANPTGKVLDIDDLRRIVVAARSVGAIVVSDECYARFGWNEWDDRIVPSLLDSRVSGSSLEGLLCVYSLSKQSNFAGYRGGFVAGDKVLISSLVAKRKHMGMIVPFPVQEAMRAVLLDDDHVVEQKEFYRQRRNLLLPALEDFGFRIECSDGGIYLWCDTGKNCWEAVSDLANLGIIVAPGIFYGSTSGSYVRVALTASINDIERVVLRLAVK